MKVIIVGGVAGGASAAARLRRLDEDMEIIMIDKTGYISYANCGLPYYIGGVITDHDELTLQTPESFKARFNVDVRVNQEVLSINKDQKTIRISKRENGKIYEENYDALILALGARALRPEMPGIEDERIMTLKTIEDTDRIHAYIENNHPQKAVVIGGGFIGLEMAENLMHRGIDTTLVEAAPQVMINMDLDMMSEMHRYLESQGLHLVLNAQVSGFKSDKNLSVMTANKGDFEADLVILAMGVRPETKLAKEAGLKRGLKEAIVVDDQMRTSAPDIYAVGDAVEITRFGSEDPALVSLAGPANKQGRLVADVIKGRDVHYHGAQATSVIKLFDKTVASTGFNENQLKAMQAPYDKVLLFAAQHASYYPGATNMNLKVLFNKENGELYGAQATGGAGVDKRIDIFATAIRGHMNAYDLLDLDLAYAPPFGSAKDPVNMAAYVITNLLEGTIKQFHWHDVPDLLNRDDLVLLDVRTKREYEAGHFLGAVNIPVDELRERLDELPQDKPLYVNCFSGLRSYVACRMLMNHGLTCYNLSGGYHFASFNLTEKEYHDVTTYTCGQERLK